VTLSRPIIQSSIAPVVEPADVRSLIRQAVGGSAPAFGELYRIYLERIYRYLFYQVKDTMTAEDMTEEVFLKMWRALPRFRGDERALTSWLYRIAHNHLIDHYRTRTQELPLSDDLDVGNSDVNEATADSALAAEDVTRLLSHLPAQQRQIIILKFIEDMDNEEIAAITGKSQGAIRITQMRALASMKRAMAKQGQGHD